MLAPRQLTSGLLSCPGCGEAVRRASVAGRLVLLDAHADPQGCQGQGYALVGALEAVHAALRPCWGPFYREHECGS